MNKVLFGLLLGAVLGAFDGMTAWFTPQVRAQLAGIVIGSTVKGLVAGILIGLFARKVHSLALGIVFGLAVGLVLAFIVAQLQHGYYLEIMLPGGMVGLIVGYANRCGPKLSGRRCEHRRLFFLCGRRVSDQAFRRASRSKIKTISATTTRR